MKTLSIASSLALLLALTACGGSSAGGPPTAGSSQQITAANAESVASAALGATTGLLDATSQAPIFQSSLHGGAGFDLSTFLADAFRRVSPGDRTAQAVLVETIPCGNGELQLILDDRDNSGDFTTGDVYEFRWINCGQGSYTVNGSMFFEAVVITSGSAGNFSASLTIRFENFSVTAPGASAFYNGTITYTVSYQNGVYSYSYSLDGDFGGLLAGSNVTRSVNANGEIVIGGDGSFAWDGSSLSFDTTNPFVTAPGDPFAYAGECIVYGTANTALIITAIDAQNVRIEVDADGDGVFETTIDTTWNALN